MPAEIKFVAENEMDYKIKDNFNLQDSSEYTVNIPLSIMDYIDKGKQYGRAFYREYNRIDRKRNELSDSVGAYVSDVFDDDIEDALSQVRSIIKKKFNTYEEKNLPKFPKFPNFQDLESDSEIYLMINEGFIEDLGIEELGLDKFFIFMGFVKVVSLEVYEQYFMPLEKMFLALFLILDNLSESNIVVFSDCYNRINNNYIKFLKKKSLNKGKNASKKYSSLENKLIKQFNDYISSVEDYLNGLYEVALNALLDKVSQEEYLTERTVVNAILCDSLDVDSAKASLYENSNYLNKQLRS